MLGTHSFDGKRALVTGGARRLGRQVAISLGNTGAALAIHYNSSAEPAETLCRELGERGCHAVPVQADLRQPDAVEGLFQESWDALGGLDFLVNNASIFPPGRMDELKLQDLHRNLAVNAWAPFLLTRALWRQIKGTAARASVVNMLDTRLVGGDLAHSAYHFSKAMLAEITTLSALEFAPELQVNGVAPGAVMPPEGMGEAHLDALVSELPLERRGYPQDVADAVTYLLGASFVTGQVIFVDGGRHIRLGGAT